MQIARYHSDSAVADEIYPLSTVAQLYVAIVTDFPSVSIQGDAGPDLAPTFNLDLRFSMPVDSEGPRGVGEHRSPLESQDDELKGRGTEVRPLRVLLVDDHKILLDGLVRVLRPERDLEVVGTASNGEEAVTLASELKPDVIVMDVSMPGMNGVTATQKIKEKLEDVRIVGLSMHEADAMAEAMLRAGANTYLTKGCPSQELLEAIRGRN